MPDTSKIAPTQGLGPRLSLFLLPVAFVAAALWVRAQGGPTWLWFNLDPDYFYLLDALNIINLTTPGHVYHPGTTVQWLAALILKIANPGTSADDLTALVLADPERFLRLISTVFVIIIGIGVWTLGVAGRHVFGGLLAAWYLQLAPLISMLVLKNAYHVKPEALLIFTGLMLAAVSVLSLAPGLLARRRWRFAIGFGVIAGFGVATKITAFPVFLLPLFVLGADAGLIGWGRAVALYGVSALAALFIFTLPAIGAYDVFINWMATVSQGSGAYGGGSGFIDMAAYPLGILKMFKRPAFHVVFILSVVTLVVAWRRRRGLALPAGEILLLAGISVSQFAHVLVVAKQPNAIYMIPSFVLIPLAFVLVWRLGERLLARPLFPGVAVLLVVLVAAQAVGVFKLAREQATKRDQALSVDMARFDACARVYSYAASSRSFALLLADYITGARFSSRLAAREPGNDFWLEHWWDQSRLVFRGWRGPENMATALKRYPCTVYRATNWEIIERLLPETVSVPGIDKTAFDQVCRAGGETLVTRGVDCRGKMLKTEQPKSP